MPQPILSVRNVSKRYGAVRALHGVSLEFSSGELHAVLGENGAGKSSLMGVLAGYVVPDAGQVVLNGEKLRLGQPQQARRSGIEMVHQHFVLVPELTVAENLALARLDSLSGSLDVPVLAQPALDIADSLNWSLDAGVLAGSLSVGAQQRVEILKALSGKSDVLILDEPTAVLSPDEVRDLFRVLRRLRDEGICIILIAHKLSEVLAVADCVSVLREGKFVASARIADVTEDQLATWMIGEMPAPSSTLPSVEAEPSLVVDGLQVLGDRGEQSVRSVSFTVAPGEVFGIGGVDGNGQVELAEALVGIRAIEAGSINWTPNEPAAIGYIPPDRQGQGLALNMSVLDNVLVTAHTNRSLYVGPFLLPKRTRLLCEQLVEDYDIRIGSLDDPVGSLSGGNQQKVVVSRTLADRPNLIIAVNPARGLDIRATAFVHESLRDSARRGAAVVLITTDLDELAALATRTAFISRGELREGGATALLGGSD